MEIIVTEQYLTHPFGEMMINGRLSYLKHLLVSAFRRVLFFCGGVCCSCGVDVAHFERV